MAFVYTVPGMPPSNVAALVAGEAEDSRDGTLPNNGMFPIQISFNFVPICEMALQPVVLQVSTKFFIPHISQDAPTSATELSNRMPGEHWHGSTLSNEIKGF